MSREVIVPRELVERAALFGRTMVAAYRDGRAERSRSVSGKWGAEGNAALQARSKVGEVATALLFGLNPESAVKWTIDAGDPGFDIVLPGLRWRADIKTTLPGRRLIWSKAVNHLYAAKNFDVLIAATIDPQHWTRCWIDGWVSKQGFFEQKIISTGADGLTEGTWFLPKHLLRDIGWIIPELERSA